MPLSNLNHNPQGKVALTETKEEDYDAMAATRSDRSARVELPGRYGVC